MSEGKKLQPIIVKRIKKGGHAAHGGAWKIAYADFVTAMMAFFLLMWLLGSTSKGDLNGIASYFTNPVKVSLLGGDGTGNSESILPGGGRDLSKSSGQVDGGEAERAAKMMGAQMARAELARKDQLRIDALQTKMIDLIENTPALKEFAAQIQLERTPDGLQIQIVDDQSRPMFDVGSAVVKPYMRDILQAIGAALVDVENRIALAGHTDATPYGSGDRGYSNWELSADRANASRRELVQGGLVERQLARVEGLAASRLLRPEEPTAPINRRISLLVMTREAEQRMFPSTSSVQPVSAADGRGEGRVPAPVPGRRTGLPPVLAPEPLPDQPAAARPAAPAAAAPPAAAARPAAASASAAGAAPAARAPVGGPIGVPDLQKYAEMPKPREEAGPIKPR